LASLLKPKDLQNKIFTLASLLKPKDLQNILHLKMLGHTMIICRKNDWFVQLLFCLKNPEVIIDLLL